MRRCVGIAALCLSASAFAAEAHQDIVLGTTVGTVDTQLFIPGGVKVLRGVLVHAAHYKLSATDRWAEVCRTLGFAHAALNINLKENNRPTKLRKALDEGLKEFAPKSGHPELPNLPFAGVGHSAGGMVSSVMLRTPERTLTTCVSCGWIADPAKLTPEAAAVPHAFTLGAIPDAFKMLPGIEERFLPARKQGRPWGLAVQWECAHDWGNSAAFFAPWLVAVCEMRIPKDWDPLAGPPKLKDVKQDDGWLGDRSTTEGNFATVASWADYQGDKALATWFPSRYVAFVWRAMMSKDPPVVLEAAAADGSAKVSTRDPKSDHTLMLNPGTDLLLTTSVKEGFSARTVSFFDGDRLLGEAGKALWQFTWKGAAQGPHAVFAQWTTPDGKQGVSHPALVVVRAKATKQE
ncbi:MAG TPA: hypothetical protein VNE39_27190 [Planctomycetota bacterium]|nr:hypothetical protein [Planctomycetota bacterium]